MATILYVALGSALGGVLRYLSGLLAAQAERVAPYSAVWSTMLINILGSFAIGYFSTATAASGRYPLSQDGRIFLMVGLCGGFTTFSAFSLQTFDLLRSGSPGRATLNVVFSVALCLVAVSLGHRLGAGHRAAKNASAGAHIEERSA